MSTLPLRGLLLFAALLLLAAGAPPSAARAAQQEYTATAGQDAGAAGPDAAGAEPSVLESDFVRTQGRRGLDLLYDMEFAKAEQVFDRISARYPDHPVGPFLNGLSTWWRILLDLPDTSHDDRFFDQMDEVIDRADALLDADPGNKDAMFFMSAARGFRGRLYSNRSRWLRAAYNAERAMSSVFDLADQNPRSADFAFGKGIYDYYAALIPEQYAMAKPFMRLFPDGSKERGLAALRRTARDGWFIQTEAHYFLLQIQYTYEENFFKSLEHVQWLRREHPHNPYFHNFEGRVYAKWGRWDDARAIFDKVLARYYGDSPGYNDHQAAVALYYMGRSHLARDEYRKALTYFVKLDRLVSGRGQSSYRTLGLLRQGMVYDALGEREAARQRYRKALDLDDYARAHERARRFLKEPYGG